MSLLSLKREERRHRELLASQPHLNHWEDDRTLLNPGNHFQAYERQEGEWE